MNVELVLLILVGSLAITAGCRKFGWPAPLVVTAVAFVVSFIPGLTVEIDSEVILTIILPPLLYSAALDISVQDFRTSLRQIRRLGIGLVVVTALAVGGVMSALDAGLSLVVALLIGAVVAPPDAVSATAIGKKLGLPRKVMTVLSGESLINDAAALTLFTLFLNGATQGSSFGFVEGLQLFMVNVAVGLVVGFVLVFIVQFIRDTLKDPLIETVVGLLVPFIAYLLAEHLHGSGVIAVVVAGLGLGYNAPRGSYAMRLQEQPIWASVDVVLEAFVFALIGLQFNRVLQEAMESPRGLGWTVGMALIVLAVVIMVRPIYVFASYYRRQVPWFKQRRREREKRQWERRLDKAEQRIQKRPERISYNTRIQERIQRMREVGPSYEPEMSWRELIVISWTGMRGVVTLASAAAVQASGIEEGHLVFIIAFVVTIGTLLIQGTTLPSLIKVLGVTDPDQEERDRRQELELMAKSYAVALEELKLDSEKMSQEVGQENVDRIFARIEGHTQAQIQAFYDESGDYSAVEKPTESISPEQKIARKKMDEVMLQARRRINDVRREVLLDERDAGAIDDEVARVVLAELDAESLSLDQSWRSRRS